MKKIIAISSLLVLFVGMFAFLATPNAEANGWGHRRFRHHGFGRGCGFGGGCGFNNCFNNCGWNNWDNCGCGNLGIGTWGGWGL